MSPDHLSPDHLLPKPQPKPSPLPPALNRQPTPSKRVQNKRVPNKCVPNKRVQNKYVRTDSEWISSLKGDLDTIVQQEAHQRLSAYLFAVALEYLQARQPSTHWLSTLDDQEIVALSQDIVQSGLEKLSNDGYARLDQYAGQGAFTSWAAQVVLNIARSELRRVRWHRLQPIDSFTYLIEADTPSPQLALEQGQIIATIHHCLEQLPPQYRTVVIRCIMHGEKPSDVAQDLGKPAQSVYNLISRAKARMRELLAGKQVEQEDLWVLAG